MSAPPPFESLRMLGYGAIIADPAWKFRTYSKKGQGKAPEAHYRTMTDAEILALPVRDLAAKDCLLILWTTWPKLEFGMETLRTWGFKYVTGGSWFKRTVNGYAAMGPGFTLRTVCEPFLLGRIGKPQVRLTDVRNGLEFDKQIPLSEMESITIEGLRREHSRKPDCMRAIVERMTPNTTARLDLFSRSPWVSGDGARHDVWGNETDKFAA